MSRYASGRYVILGVLSVGFALGYIVASSNIQPSQPVEASQAERPAAGVQTKKGEPMISPVKARGRDFYAPNSEDLGPDEIRVIALGTGMPTPRPFQAAACFLMELGNGDKFIFDIGDGSVERLFALQIPTAFLDKVFIGHLHGDHFGDIGSLFVAGGIAGRFTPLRIWGPSGATPELGTKAAIEAMEKMFAWDIGTRSGVIDFRGGQLEVNEFDFDGVNKVIYDENEVIIRSIPAIHGLDGAVSFILEWNGMKFVYGSDTYPNKWYTEYAAGADLAIHECFLPPTLMVTKQGFAPLEALTVGTQGHTSPEQFGKVMSIVKPRLAVGYHFYNDFDTEPDVRDRVRKTYDGPLSLAVDYMVWNVTKDDIKVRMAAKDEEVWPSPALRKKVAPDFTKSIPMSEFTLSGKQAFPEVVAPLYEEINEIYGTDFKPGIQE